MIFYFFFTTGKFCNLIVEDGCKHVAYDSQSSGHHNGCRISIPPEMYI